MDAGFAPILFVLLVSMTAVRSQIRKGPSNALKKVGDSVMLECVTVNKNCDQVDWAKVEGLQSPKLVFRNGNGKLNNDLYPPQRYSVNSTGGCSLAITQLEINDSGRFICMQAVDSREETRSSILVVIGVKASCLSNVTSNVLDKDGGYSFRCAIIIPAKSVEPSNVTLSFHNKTANETETTDEKQPLTVVKTTLTGIAKKENITPRGCRASFLPNTEANYDSTVAFLDVCTTQQLIVSSVQSQIRGGLENALKRAGESVTLECVIVNKNCDQVEWQKVEGQNPRKRVYQTGIEVHHNEFFSPRRYIVEERDGFSLTITRLEINDTGRFTCSCVQGAKERNRRSIQQLRDKEDIQASNLVVISVAESCESNVTSNALDKDDGYSLWCTIDIPDKSVELSNVTLSFQNEAAVETYTTNGTQLKTVRTILTGIATKENITRVCRASFTRNRQDKYDNTTVTLEVCTKHWIVSYPVENINVSLLSGKDGSCTVRCTADGHPSPTFKWTHSKSEDVVVGDTLVIKGDDADKYTCTATNTVKGKETSKNITIDLDFFRLADAVEGVAVSPSGPYYKGDKILCIANGYPPPTIKWMHWKSEAVLDNDTLVIMGDAGDKYNCTATNTFKGTAVSKSILIEVSDKPKSGAMQRESSDNRRQAAEVAVCGPGCVAGVVCGCLIIGVVIGGVAYAGLKDERSPLYVWLHSRKKKNEEDGETAAYVPVTDSASSGPVKPPQDD